MKKLRIVCLPFVAIFELLMLLAAWVLVFVGKTAIAEKVVNKANSLPNLNWYLGKDEQK